MVIYHGRIRKKSPKNKNPSTPRDPITLSEDDWGVQSPPKRKVFRFHETILRFGEPGSLGYVLHCPKPKKPCICHPGPEKSQKGRARKTSSCKVGFFQGMTLLRVWVS